MKSGALFVFLLLALLNSAAQADQPTLLKSDQSALQARVDLIQKGNEILVEYYSIADDDVSTGFYGLLLQAADRGAQVKILVDALTSKTSNATLAALTSMGSKNGKSNFQIKVFNAVKLVNSFALNHRTHAKIVLIDGKEVITGGRNMADEYYGLNDGKNFLDTDIYLKGAAASATRDNFLKQWNSAIATRPVFGPDELSQVQERTILLEQKISSVLAQGFKMNIHTDSRGTEWLSESSEYIVTPLLDDVRRFATGQNKTEGIGKKYLATLSRAQKNLTIVTPYLIPTDDHFYFFKQLIARGVKVKILTNSINSSDDLRAIAAYYSQKQNLISLGLEIHEFEGPKTLHSKLAVIDDQIGVIGTFNFDPRSYGINREMAMVVHDPDNKGFVADLNQEVASLISNSLLVGKDENEVNLERQKNRAVPENRLKSVEKYKNLLGLLYNQL